MTFDQFLKAAGPFLDLNWRKYRRRAARHRVQDRMKALGLEDYRAYWEFIQNHPTEAEALADRMRITISRFFRERPLWMILAREIIPHLLLERPEPRIFRAWSAGSCGGEEPYTLALLWLETLHPRYPDCQLALLATDIDLPGLERAARGIYDQGSLREVPAELLEKGFDRLNHRWQVADRVRRLVEFKQENLMIDAFPSEMDLVCCRYLVFTYYTGRRRLEAAKRLYQALRPGGVLMIGGKERLQGPEREGFEPWPGQESFWIKRKNERNGL